MTRETPTLHEAIERRLRQYKLLGWRPSRRRQIEVSGNEATLVLGWLYSDGKSQRPSNVNDPIIAGEYTVTVDTTNLPKGVTVEMWSALADTHDAIRVPTEREVRDAAALLGCRYVDRGIAKDRTIYWMVK